MYWHAEEGKMIPANEPLVSVVTPVYNDRDYLSECIESVLGQTYQNWEYTIVSNCCTDGSAEIAHHYAEKDARIKVHENAQFLKVVPNHNHALRQISASSKYCKIVFADDWIFPECLEQMVSFAEAHPSAGVIGAYGLDGENVIWGGLPYHDSCISGSEICRRLFLKNLYVFGTSNSVLYRADLVRNREQFFNEDNFHADKEACIELLKTCDFGFVHQILTYTRVRPHSLLMMSRTINTILAGHLYSLAKHGRYFLSDSEFDKCLQRVLAEYYSYLAGSLLRGRDKGFWEYHKKIFMDASVRFSRARLARAVAARLWVAAANPKSTLQILLRNRPDESATFFRELS